MIVIQGGKEAENTQSRTEVLEEMLAKEARRKGMPVEVYRKRCIEMALAIDLGKAASFSLK